VTAPVMPVFNRKLRLCSIMCSFQFHVYVRFDDFCVIGASHVLARVAHARAWQALLDAEHVEVMSPSCDHKSRTNDGN
jgi:hypothetical protein